MDAESEARVRISSSILWGNKPARVGDVKHSLADISRATAWMGWHPSTSLEDGIEKTVASFGVDVDSAQTKA